jgi:RNA polymerase sigma-70 factor (ECF subfamily)
LKAQAGDGDAQAMERLLASLTPHVVRAVRAVLGSDTTDLEDCAQESLLAVAYALPSFRGDSSLVHFTRRIAARTAYAARKRRARTERGTKDFAEATDLLQAPASWPSDDAFSARQKEVLARLLDQLPSAQATALYLREGLGYTLGELALAQGVSINTLRSRIRRAKEVLRHCANSDPRIAELLDARK